MARLGNYSAQAIQARQIHEFNKWVQTLPTQTQAAQTSQPQTTTPAKPQLPAGNFTLPIAQPPQQELNIPNTPGYMAADTANINTILGTKGTEDVYYAGQVRDGLLGTWDALIANPFRNWARRTYANINNPRDLLPAPTPEQTAKIEERSQYYKKNTEASSAYAINEFVMEDVFGIDMEETYKTAAVKDVAKEAGVNTFTKELTGSLKETGKAAFFGVLGAFEWGARNGIAVLKGIDQTADEVAGHDGTTADRIIDGATKLQRATAAYDTAVLEARGLDEYSEKLNTYSEGAIRKLNFLKVISTINPIDVFMDAGRLVANLDKIRPGQLAHNINREIAGSQAVYSRIYDDAMNQEYIRRYENGESPQKLVLEIQNAGVELTGGVFLDPTTFFSPKAAAKLFDPKTGARIVQEGLKSASLNAIDNGLLDVRMVKEVKGAFETIVKTAEGTKPTTVQEGLDVINDAFRITKEVYEKWRNTRGLTSLTSTAKVGLVVEQTTDVLQKMAASVADHPDGMDLMTGALDAMITFSKTGGDKKAFTALANNPIGEILLSPRGMRTAHLMSGLDEAMPAIKRAIESGDVKQVANIYANQIETVVGRTIRSVEEMRGARETIDNLTNKIGGNAVIDTARVAIKNAADMSEKLTGVKTVLTETKTAVRDMLDEFKGLVKVTSGKVKYLQSVRGNVLDNADKQIADLSTQLKALKSVTKDGQTQKAIAEIKGTLDEIRKLKKVAVVEDIGKAKGSYESAKETLRLLSERLDGDIKKVVDAVERAVIEKNKAYASLKDLAVDGRPVRELIEQLDNAAKMAEEYRKLPAAVRFVNGMNEVGKRTWLAPMKLFAETYFGLNRFAYPARNVMSAIPGMAYELGWTNALEIAAKSIPGSQFESLGIRTLNKYHDEIERILGYVPEAFKRGDTAIGEFVKTKEKYLGAFRGGGHVAQLSEQLMGAQIMYKTIKREMRNALQYGVIPDSKALEAVGLHGDDAKKLLQYAMEYEGDTKKTLDAFRKFKGGVEETFRHMLPTRKMTEFLEHLGNGSDSAVKKMEQLRENAQSVDEFRNGMKEIREGVEGFGEWSRTEKTQLSETVNPDYLRDISEAQRLKYASPETLDNFERVLQGWQNSEEAMYDASKQMFDWLKQNGVDTGEYLTRMMEATHKTYPRQNAVRQLVRSVYEAADTLTSVQMWEKLNSFEDFKLASMTQLDPAKATTKEIISVMWEAYYAWSGRARANFATEYNDELVKMLEEATAKIGTDIPTAAKMANVPFQKAVDSYNYAKKLYKESTIDPLVKLRRTVKPGTTLLDVDMAGLKKAGFTSKDHLFHEINRYRREMGQRAWDTMAQVDFWEVEDAVVRMRRSHGFIPNFAEPIATKADDALGEAVKQPFDLINGEYVQMLHPPIAPDKAATPSRMVYESLGRFTKEFDAYTDNVVSHWGETTAPVGALTDEVEGGLAKWADTLTKNMNRAKQEAGTVAQATRDAMLYDYRKSLWNVAAQYVSPFHYYHVSASKQWLQNAAADPKWGAIYVDYKEFMEQRHAGLPDFWKQNVAVSGLPGYDKDNPLFFNIEASVNPIYQMVGQDFNDPNRRKDWLSTTVDDLSKVIPGMYQPLSWVVAANLYRKGEDDAVRRWVGRIIPQTRIVKTTTNALGIDIPIGKYNELDPFVNMFGDGLDTSEEGRVNRYLAAMPVSEEAKIQAAHDRSGSLWEEAVRGSLSARAPVEAMSYFLGVGYKPRTAADVETDRFYEDYRKLISARSIMPQDEYRDAWDAMRSKYKFMDALLIGRKAGDDRDTALAYNVLGRIPPGEMTDIAKFLHVEPYMLDSFYSNKGDLSKMLPQDRDRFMAAILDLSAMMRMPDGATKSEWTQAKRTYTTMQDELKKQYGAQILDQMYQYYDLGENDRKDYLETFPNVDLALQAQTAFISNTPILAAYYGGIDTVARYYNNVMYIQLEQEFGSDIQVKVDAYYFMLDNGETKQASAYKKQMGLTAYFARKEILQQTANLAAINSAKDIPEGRDYAIRPEFEAQSGIQQSALNYATTDQQAQMAQVIWTQLSDPMKQLIQEYLNPAVQKPLPYAVGKRLEYLGDDLGLSKQEVLRLLGIELP